MQLEKVENRIKQEIKKSRKPDKEGIQEKQGGKKMQKKVGN